MDDFSIMSALPRLSSSGVEKGATSGFPKTADTVLMLQCRKQPSETGSPKTDVSARKISTLSRHHKIVDGIIQSQIPELTVDQASRQTMAEALQFSGIDTLEQAEALHLRIIPPGPILHTWYAEYKTGLFDGKNNPAHVEGLDYVTRVSEQADRLKEWGIPVILVYLERNMPPAELRKMQTLFCDHENILVMSLESDLTRLESARYHKRPDVFQLLDGPRFSLCREFPEVLSLAQKKAESVGKTLLLHNLRALGGLSIIYSDIDNTFLCRPMFQLAVHGLTDVSAFRQEFSLQDDSIYKNYSASPVLSATAEKHREIFLHEGFTACKKRNTLSIDSLKDKSGTLHKYLLSGEALENYRYLNPESDTDVMMFVREFCGYIAVNKSALTVVDQHLDSTSGITWHSTFAKKQNLDNQLLNLHGLQQIKQIHIGRDKTWV